MYIAIAPPLPPGLSREHFHQTYLLPFHYPDKDLAERAIPMLLIMDYFVRLMCAPYLYIEIQRIQKVIEERGAFIKCQRLRRLNPDFAKKTECKHLKVSSISHSAFLRWVTMSFVNHVKGVPCPRPFLKMLHFTSVSFGLISMGYDKDSEVREFFRIMSPYFPNGQIYR